MRGKLPHSAGGVRGCPRGDVFGVDRPVDQLDDDLDVEDEVWDDHGGGQHVDDVDAAAPPDHGQQEEEVDDQGHGDQQGEQDAGDDDLSRLVGPAHGCRRIRTTCRWTVEQVLDVL